MEQTVFVANPTRLLIAAAVGIIVLLILIIKFKLHPVISMMIAAIIIGVGAGMPLTMISDTVENGVGKTLQGIALLVGLGSMFGGILEVSGGAQRIAQTLIDKLGQKKAGILTISVASAAPEIPILNTIRKTGSIIRLSDTPRRLRSIGRTVSPCDCFTDVYRLIIKRNGRSSTTILKYEILN